MILILSALNVERLITDLLTISRVEEMARHVGREDVISWTQIEEFDYQSGESFINAPLIADFLLKGWLAFVPEQSKGQVIDEVARLIDNERHNADFSLTVKATLVMGKKVDLPLAS